MDNEKELINAIAEFLCDIKGSDDDESINERAKNLYDEYLEYGKYEGITERLYILSVYKTGTNKFKTSYDDLVECVNEELGNG